MKSVVFTTLLLAPTLVLGLLDVKIKAKGKKYFGSAADPATINTAIDVTILTADYGAYTPENSMKWDATEHLDAPGSKTNGMVALVNRLKSRGVPIDGIGTQTHISIGHAGTIAGNLQTLANTGLDVAITELDIASSTSTADQAQQSSDYKTVANACLSVSRCVGITTWGVSDKDSWLGAAKAPLLWDTNFVRKPAYTGVDSAFS